MGRGILRETDCSAIRSSEFLSVDVFMRCAGVGAGMLDENPWLDELGSVIGTSDGGMSHSEGGHCCGSSAASFSKSDASAEI